MQFNHARTTRRSSRRLTAHRNRAYLETLESRSLFSGVPVAGAVPILHSNPNATVKVFLDFDGDTAMAWSGYNVTDTPAYDTDGDAANFSTTELANIQQIWARVAEKYSPFNIDVTTQQPASFADGQGVHVVIGGLGTWTGLTITSTCQFNSFFNANMANMVYDFSARNFDPGSVAESVAHEVSRTFGLYNQTVFDVNGLASINPGNVNLAPIMGNAHATRRGLWWNGAANFPTNIQDDVGMLATKFGYRTDDHGGSITSATALTGSGTTLSGGGIIEKTTDSDYFTFTTSGGNVTINVNNGPVANYMFAGMLDSKVQVLNAAGQQVAFADNSTTTESITANLAAGTYTIVISGHGQTPCYDSALIGSGQDLGQYAISVTLPGVVNPVPAQATGLTATGGNNQVSLTWNAVSGATTYNVYRSTASGAETLLLSGLTGTSYTNTGLAGGTTYYYKVAAVNASGTGAQSLEKSAATTTAQASLTKVTAVYVSSSQWSQAFRDSLAASGQGDATLGYKLSTGNATQLQALPWANLDQITLVFSTGADTNVVPVFSGASRTYSPSRVTLANANAVTYAFAAPLATDSLTVSLTATAFNNATGNTLDGEWTDAASTTSGNGVAGGNFTFKLNILPGDTNHDGIVDGADLDNWFRHLQQRTFATTSGDLNADGIIDGADLDVLSTHLQMTLPA